MASWRRFLATGDPRCLRSSVAGSSGSGRCTCSRTDLCSSTRRTSTTSLPRFSRLAFSRCSKPDSKNTTKTMCLSWSPLTTSPGSLLRETKTISGTGWTSYRKPSTTTKKKAEGTEATLSLFIILSFICT